MRLGPRRAPAEPQRRALSDRIKDPHLRSTQADEAARGEAASPRPRGRLARIGPALAGEAGGAEVEDKRAGARPGCYQAAREDVAEEARADRRPRLERLTSVDKSSA